MDAALARRRAAAQLLHRPVSARHPADIAAHIAGAQAQDRFAGPLHFRSRSRKLTAADIDRARNEERTLIRTWLMRMTVHLIPSEDAGWWLPLFEPAQEKWSRRRLDQLGMPAAQVEKAMREVRRMLGADGPLSRNEVRSRLKRAGVEFDQQAGLHLIGLATVSGLAIQGPDAGALPSLVLREEWLGKAPRFERDKALAELSRRYLRAFAPASERDFARWSGLGLREVRGGLEAISSELAGTRNGEEMLLSLKRRKPRLPHPGQLRLLGAFDTYMLGYASREFAAAPENAKAVNPLRGGMIEPVIVRDGELLGTWKLARKDRDLEVNIHPFAKPSAADTGAIEEEIADVRRFEGRTG